MVKLSIIVPVYNVAPYLRKCVDSLIHQDFENYEIILVDDGSTDESSNICDELVCSNELVNERVSELGKPLIRVIHQSNAGLSAARNAGLKEAKGEYVCFVDSDDYWESNVLGSLMEQVKRENLDVLRFDYRNVRLTDSVQCTVYGVQNEGVNGLGDERYEVFEPNKYPHQVDRRNEVVDGETYLNTRMGYACYAVMFVIKRSLLVYGVQCKVYGEGCLFTEGIHFEDTEWLPRMMLRAKRVNSTPLIVYNYFLHEGSITQVQGRREKIRENTEDCMTIIERYNQYIEQYSDCRWLLEMRSMMVVSVLARVAQHLYSERKEYITRLKVLRTFPLTKEARQGKIYLRKARLINISPRLAVEMLHLKNG